MRSKGIKATWLLCAFFILLSYVGKLSYVVLPNLIVSILPLLNERILSKILDATIAILLYQTSYRFPYSLYTVMAKEIKAYVKVQAKGGQANPSPPLGPALGSKGINIMEFCKQFNARTQDRMGQLLPVIITLYTDKSFDFVIKTPPAPILLMEAAKVKSGSAVPNRDKVGSVTWEQVQQIAETKMPDLNAFTLESAMKMVAGTARSMGINVVGKAPWEN